MSIYNKWEAVNLVNTYWVLVDGITKWNKKEVIKAVTILKNTIKKYINYKKENIVKKKIIINGKIVTLETPIFRDSKLSKAVANVNKKIIRVIEKHVSSENIEKAIESYNNFLLSIKVYKDSHNLRIKSKILKYVTEFKSYLK